MSDSKRPPFQVGDIIQVKIEKLSFGGGRGVARHQGMVVFVPYVAPEEVVQVKISKIKKSFAEADLVEIIKSNPKRATPPCQYYGNCGGCTWQHLDYELQLQIKQQLIEDFYSKAGFGVEIPPVIPSPKTFHYRNRGQFEVNRSGQMCFHRRGSSELIAIEQCLLLEKGVNEFLTTHKPKTGLRIELFRSISGEVGARSCKNYGEEYLFSQVNEGQNANLKSFLFTWLSELNPLDIIELYAGSGNLSMNLANISTVEKIVSVEASERLVKIALQNNTDSRINFVADDCGSFLKNLSSLRDRTLVLLDPPRTGLNDRVIANLLRLNPNHLVYISCNPSTQIRDLKMITEAAQYTCSKVLAFDMFPQTDHLEVMTLVSRL